MHKSEPKTNPTLITYANKVYELKPGAITLVFYVNNNETRYTRVHDLLSIVFSLPMNWCL